MVVIDRFHCITHRRRYFGTLIPVNTPWEIPHTEYSINNCNVFNAISDVKLPTPLTAFYVVKNSVMDLWLWFFNIGSGYGLSNSTASLPGILWTYHQLGPMSFTFRQCHTGIGKPSYFKSPKEQWVNVTTIPIQLRINLWCWGKRNMYYIEKETWISYSAAYQIIHFFLIPNSSAMDTHIRKQSLQTCSVIIHNPFCITEPMQPQWFAK